MRPPICYHHAHTDWDAKILEKEFFGPENIATQTTKVGNVCPTLLFLSCRSKGSEALQRIAWHCAQTTGTTAN